MPEVSAKGVLIGIAAVVTGIAVALAASWLVVRSFGIDPAGASRATAPQVAGPPPQSAPPDDLSKYRKEKTDRLTGYGPVDGDPGYVHIPIDRAMRMRVE